MAEFEARGVTVRDVKATAFIAAFAEYLKNNNVMVKTVRDALPIIKAAK